MRTAGGLRIVIAGGTGQVGNLLAKNLLPIWRGVIEAPELWGGGLEAKAHFGSAAMLLTQVHNSAVLFLAVGFIPQDKACAKSDGS